MLENEKGPLSVSENGVPHTYFALEPQSADMETTNGTGTGSHDNFALSLEEETGCVASVTNSDLRPIEDRPYLKHVILDETQTYFENPISRELEDDIHQYQAIGQTISTTCVEDEHTNHNYFMLEKETEQ